MPKKTPSSTRLLKLLILVAAGLFIITVASLWLGSNSFSDKGVTLSIDGPASVSSGDEVTYTIKYSNTTSVALTNMSFRLFYPDGTIVLKDGKPTNPESEGFAVDQLSPGQSGQKEFKVFIIGDKGAIKTAKINLIFSAGTLKSSFTKEASIATTISTLPVNMTLVAPPTAVAGQVVQYILDVRNDSQVDLTNLKVLFTYPDGFVVQKMDPLPDEGNTTWNLDSLKVNEGKRFTISGMLPGNERETKTVKVVLQHELNGQYVDYVSSDAFTMISSPLLSIRLVPNDNRDYVSFAGDSLKYTLTYTNNSQYTFLGLLLGVKLEGDMYNFASLRVEKGFFDSTNNIVDFDSSGVPEFASLRPGQTGKLTFTVPLKPGLTGGSGAKNFFVKATARLSTTNVPSGVEGSEVFSLDSVITKISSQPTLTGIIAYDNGEGSGAMPPKVGQETVLTVHWQLANPGNDVRNSVVSATLPPGVTFKDLSSATNGTAPVFDRTTNKVSWNLGLLPFGTGTGVPKYEAKFQISIRPSSNQVGQLISLVNGAALNGTDGFTDQAIQVRLRDTTTADVENHADDARVTQ
jgi:uncharacterized repeat protein (TIGR01451 family)